MDPNFLCSILEAKYFRWNHFIPFPRGHILYLPDDKNKKPSFLTYRRANTKTTDARIFLLCDPASIYADKAYDDSVLESFLKKNASAAIEIRMREASLCTSKTLEYLFYRHNLWMDVEEDGDDLLTESMIYISCHYSYHNKDDTPNVVKKLKNNANVSFETISEFLQDKAFFKNQIFGEESEIRWQNNQLGPFCVYFKGDYWHVAHKKLRQTIMKNFLHKMDAMIHAESLYSFYTTHYNREYLNSPLSVLDFIHFDVFKPTEGKIQYGE